MVLEMNHKATVNGGHFGNVNAAIAGRSTFKNSVIDNLVLMPVPREDWSAEIDHGVNLTGKTRVNTLIITEPEFVAQEMDGVNRPLVTLSDNASINRMEIYGDPRMFEPAWISGANVKEVQIEGEEPMDYAAFLAFIGK